MERVCALLGPAAGSTAALKVCWISWGVGCVDEGEAQAIRSPSGGPIRGG